MALYECSIIGKCYEQQMVNRFHYGSDTLGIVAGGAQALADNFLNGVLAAIRETQRNELAQVEWDTIAVRDLYNPTDFGELVNLALTGSNVSATECVSPFTAVSYRSPRFKTGKNRAQKRFAGIPEGHITGNVYSDPVPQLGLETALVTLLFDFPTSTTFTPVLLFLEKVAGTPPTYQLYATEAAQRAEMAVISQMDYSRLTTQRSRIEGHGA